MADDLVYYLDDQPGITRRKHGQGFTYRAPDGTSIARGPERKRLESLGVPPAYVDVWMSPLENGHLQATGRDVRKRKQYRYHIKWSERQAETKFDGLAEFAHVLPRIRARVQRDLTDEPGEQSFALASAVTLIDRLSMRVGGEEYARENGSYGALTLRNRHVTLNGARIDIAYKAKGGQRVRRRLSDRKLARVLENAADLPGAELLSWVDDAGESRKLTSGALNGYLAEIAKMEGITAKTFRTWAGSVAAFEAAESGDATIKAMAEAAAERLHNTPTVARNSYIHPKVIDLAGSDPGIDAQTTPSGLMAAERRLLRLLES